MNQGVYGNLDHCGNRVIGDQSAKCEGVYSVSKVI